MWRLGIALGSVLALLLSVAATSDASSHRKPPPRCPPGHPHLIVADAQAQVYIRSQGYSEGEDVYLGCAHGRRHSYVVGGASEEISSQAGGETSRLTLAGPILAREESSWISGVLGEAGENKWHVVVTDLRTGRVVHEVPTGTPNPPEPRLVGDGATTALVVKSDGSVAWIVDVYGSENPVEYQVHALDRSGGRVLASGAGIAPTSLALAGSTLYWTQGGKPMSAPLS